MDDVPDHHGHAYLVSDGYGYGYGHADAHHVIVGNRGANEHLHSVPGRDPRANYMMARCSSNQQPVAAAAQIRAVAGAAVPK